MSLKCLMEELQKTEVLRKHLHNHVQMLRGSMRVFCRIKPLQNEGSEQLELRKSSGNQNCISYPATPGNELPTSLELMDC
jgi:hypothetical protein